MTTTRNKMSYPGDSEFVYLDDEEKQLIDSIENNKDWKPIHNTNEKQLIIEAAKKHFKNKSLTLRISERDYEGIKEKANEEGLPYQTLITSIIHKYITGQLQQVK